MVVPLAFSTASAAFYSKEMIKIPLPSTSPSKQDGVIFVWGGSSSVGSSAIQLVRASGFEVFTTVSSHNIAYAKELGATRTFDRSSSSIVQDIDDALKGKNLVAVYATLTQPASMEPCRGIAKAGGLRKVIGVLPISEENKEKDGVKYDLAMAPPTQKAEYGPTVYEFLEKALEKGSFLCRPKPKVVGKGLGDVQKALDELKEGVSATKIVVTM